MPNPHVPVARVEEEVRKALAKALRKPESAIEMDASVISDLGGTSLDFLDVTFRLEQTFGIRMAHHVILDHLEETFGEGKAVDEKNRITREAAEVLRLRLGDHPTLQGGMYADEVPGFVTPRTLSQGVEEILTHLPAACTRCGASSWVCPDGARVRCGACEKEAVYPDGDTLTKAWLEKVNRERKIFAAA